MTRAALPIGWVEVPLAIVGKWTGGGTPSKSKPTFWENGTIPWVSPKDMKQSTLHGAEDSITEVAVVQSATQVVQPGSVLVVTRSGILRHTLPVATNAVAVALNQDLKAITPYEGFDAAYIAWALRAFEARILHDCSKAGTTVQSVETSKLQSFKVPIAPTTEQRRIVAALEEHLSDLDAAVAALDRARANLERHRHAVLAAAFTGALLGHEQAQGGPPVGWGNATIPELLQRDGIFVDGDWVESKDQDPSGDVRLVQLADVGDGAYRNKSARFLTSAKAADLHCTYLQAGDVLIARMPDPLGRACIFPGDPKRAVTVVDVCVVRTGTGGPDHRWLTHAINSPQFRMKVAALQSGSTRKRISRSNLATIPLPVPPIGEQCRLADAVDSQLQVAERTCGDINVQLARAARLRQSILKRAFEGKLVRQDPNDEPASALLACLRDTSSAISAPRARGGRTRTAALRGHN